MVLMLNVGSNSVSLSLDFCHFKSQNHFRNFCFSSDHICMKITQKNDEKFNESMIKGKIFCDGTYFRISDHKKLLKSSQSFQCFYRWNQQSRINIKGLVMLELLSFCTTKNAKSTFQCKTQRSKSRKSIHSGAFKSFWRSHNLKDL